MILTMMILTMMIYNNGKTPNNTGNGGDDI